MPGSDNALAPLQVLVSDPSIDETERFAINIPARRVQCSALLQHLRSTGLIGPVPMDCDRTALFGWCFCNHGGVPTSQALESIKVRASQARVQ